VVEEAVPVRVSVWAAAFLAAVAQVQALADRAAPAVVEERAVPAAALRLTREIFGVRRGKVAVVLALAAEPQELAAAPAQAAPAPGVPELASALVAAAQAQVVLAAALAPGAGELVSALVAAAQAQVVLAAAPVALREQLARKEQRQAGGLLHQRCCAERRSLAAELPAWLAGKPARGQAVAHIR
jgi:hypothetical protein